MDFSYLISLSSRVSVGIKLLSSRPSICLSFFHFRKTFTFMCWNKSFQYCFLPYQTGCWRSWHWWYCHLRSWTACFRRIRAVSNFAGQKIYFCEHIRIKWENSRFPNSWLDVLWSHCFSVSNSSTLGHMINRKCFPWIFSPGFLVMIISLKWPKCVNIKRLHFIAWMSW